MSDNTTELDFGTTAQKATDGEKLPVVLLALDQGRYDMTRSLDELRALADANGMDAVAEVVQKRATPEAATMLGEGKVAEARVWSVARTPEQIWENMYEIENPQDDPTLLGYWKCNDASGNTVKDYSMYRNDGVAKYDIIWPQGIEIPKLNENNE